jgi:hypothetical protein
MTETDEEAKVPAMSEALYQEQWVKLLAMSGEIATFVRDNAANLSAKG